MKHDISGIEDITLFVNDFYMKVRKDELIGPVFNNVIRDWTPHLEKMYQFWNAVLFGVAGFKGNPFAKHAPLPIHGEHFDRWLELFRETIDRYFEGEVAEETKKRADIMAIMFLNKLQNMNGGPGNVLV